MTVSSTTSRISYAGNASTTAFSVPFKFLANGDLVVLLQDTNGDDTVQTLNTHYTVAGAGEDAGGTVTFLTAPGATDTVVIYRDPALTQLTDYTEGDAFPVETVETALDRLTMQGQRVRDLVERTPNLLEGDTDGSGRYDANENRIVDLADPEDDQDAATMAWVMSEILAASLVGYTGTISSFMGTLLDDASASAALDTLLFSTLAKNLRDDTTLDAHLTTLGLISGLRTFLESASMGDALSNLGISDYYIDLLDDTDAVTARTSLGAHAIPKTIGGLEIAHGTDASNDIDFSAGVASNNAGTAWLKGTAMTKRLDAVWAAGTGNGGRASGAATNGGVAAASTWYHCFIVDRTNGSIDFGFDDSVTAANLLTDTGGTQYHMVGSIKTDGSKVIIPYKQTENWFQWVTPVMDHDVSNLGATRLSYALSTPLGVKCRAEVRVIIKSDGDYIVISDLDEVTAAPSLTASPGIDLSSDGFVDANRALAARLRVLTNTSSQIGARASGASTELAIVTVGFEHPRGRW